MNDKRTEESLNKLLNLLDSGVITFSTIPSNKELALYAKEGESLLPGAESKEEITPEHVEALKKIL